MRFGYTAFHNARSAEYIDESGKKQKVSRINGASDIYDVIKFSLDTKSKEFLAVAKAASPQGSAVYILRKGSAKKPEAVASKINVKKDVSGGTYYELALPYDEKNVGCPVVNEEGGCVAVVQRNVGKDATTYAISASFCENLKVKETDYANSALNTVYIPKTLPDAEDAAYTYIYMLSQVSHDNSVFSAALQDFVEKYPNNADGYVERAKYNASQGKFNDCETDIAKAVSLSDKKTILIMCSAGSFTKMRCTIPRKQIPQVGHLRNPRPRHRKRTILIRFRFTNCSWEIAFSV